MATIVTENIGSMGPWLVAKDGELKPHDGISIEKLLTKSEWDRRNVVTLDIRDLDGFAPGAERALRHAAQIVHDKHALFTVVYDPKGPAAVGLSLSGVMADLQIDFAPATPDGTARSR